MIMIWWYCSALRKSYKQGGICKRKVKKDDRCFQHKNQPTYSLVQIMANIKEKENK